MLQELFPSTLSLRVTALCFGCSQLSRRTGREQDYAHFTERKTEAQSQSIPGTKANEQPSWSENTQPSPAFCQIFPQQQHPHWLPPSFVARGTIKMSPVGSFVSSGPEMILETQLLPAHCTLGFFAALLLKLKTVKIRQSG